MNYVVNAILLFAASAQIGCTGSDNLPPVFSGETDFRVAEGQQLNLDLKFIDPEGEPVRLSVSGGNDRAHFALSSAGELIFVHSPDFEFPADADSNNRYELTIAGSDGTHQTLQPISIEVTNVRHTVAVNNSRLFIDNGGLFGFAQSQPVSSSLDANGAFLLDGLVDNSIVVSVGGNDKISGIDLGNFVLAGFARIDEDFNITPLSTILVNLGLTDTAAIQQLLVALGVDSQLTTNDIVALDPWGLVQSGDSSADSLLRINQQLLNLMLTLGNLAPEDTIQASVDSNRALASVLLAYTEENTGRAIDLGSAEVVGDIIAEVAAELNSAIAQDEQAIFAVAAKLALLNRALQNQSINPIGSDAAAIIRAIQVQLQDAVQQLSAVEDAIGIEQFEDLTSLYQLFTDLSDVSAIALDSDTYSPGIQSSSNNTLVTAQPVANPVTLLGYINTAGEGEIDASTNNGDGDDIFQIEALGGEVINLVMPASYPADLDLYVYDSSYNLIDFSVGDERFESLQLPANAGTYYIDVRGYDTGASSYDLTIGYDEPLSSTALSAAQSTFVIGHMIVQQTNDEPDISDLLDGYVASQQWRSSSAVTSLYINSAIISNPSTELALKADTLRTIKGIANDSRVVYAEPNFIRQHMTNPFTGQWYANGLTSPVALSVVVNTVVSDNNNVTVAVIDTGIWQSHPDLEIAITEQYDFVSDTNNAGDGDGIDEVATDPGDGRDNNQCQNSASVTSSFHGTQVAGVIGGYEQGASAESLPISLMNLRVLGCNGGYDFDIANAIRYAAGLQNSSNRTVEPADIINLSLGAAGYSTTLQQAVAEARHNQVIIIAAAGNQASSGAYYPAAYDDVIAVSATNAQEDLASYSNFGSAIDISAPGGEGEMTLSAVINNAVIEADTKAYQGTSIATAHISGVVALMKSAHADLTPYDLDTLIMSGEISRDFGNSGRDDNFGYGLINQEKAVGWANRLANGEPLPTITGRVISNPIAGSDVFIDTDNDFTQDEDETVTTSDTDGFFTLDIADEDGLQDNSIVVSVGGTDSVTGTALDNLLLAGFAQNDDIFAITPITTLLATVDTEDIEALLNGFAIEGSPLLEAVVTIDPWDLLDSGDQDQVDTADDLLRTNQQLLNLMLTLDSLSDHGGGEQSAIANNQALATTLLSYLQDNDAESIDLGDVATLSAIINNVAGDLDFAIAADTQAIAAVASSLASLNTLLRDASVDPKDQIAAVAISAAQNELQDAIQQLSSGTIGIEQFNNNTAVTTLFDEHPAFTQLPDSDNDGQVDLVDNDDDGDNVADGDDAFPNDENETVDSDGDGTGDNTDAFPNNESEVVDSDGDGTGDNADTDTDASRVGLQNSQIFIDSNGNFTQDENEASTTSNNNGFFDLDGVDSSSIIVAAGGADIVTDNTLDNLVLAGFGRDDQSFTLTPISTLLVSLESGGSQDAQALLAALGLDESLSVDAVATVDPLAAVQQGEQGQSNTADNLLRTNQQLLNLMLTLDSLTADGDENSALAINETLASKLLSYMQNNDGESIDLSNTATLSAIIADVATELGLAIATDTQAIAAVASRLAPLNALLNDATISPIDDVVAAIISAAQEELQTATQQLAAGSITAEVFNSKTSVSTLFSGHPAFAGLPDSDNDGLVDLVDNDDNAGETLDSDGDGVADNNDAFPDDASESLDSDDDGVGDNSDAFPDDATESLDSDGDDIGDNADTNTDASRVGLQDSQVFVDSNGNFTQDENEVATATTSNENGFFSLDVPNDSSIVVSKGGTDIITDNALDDLLLAGFGREDDAFSITPISTLLVNVGAEDSQDSQDLLAALGLESSLSMEDIVTTDPLTPAQMAEQGDSTNTDELLRTNQQLLNLMLTASSLVSDDDTGGGDDSAIATNAALATSLLGHAETNQSIDLADADLLKSIISDIAAESDFAITPEAIEAIASRLATLNIILSDESIDPTDEVAVAAISAAQDELQDAIQQLSAGGNVEDFENNTEIATLFDDLTSLDDLLNSDNDDLPDVIDDNDDNDDKPDRDELFDTDPVRQGNISGINGSASLATGPIEHQTLEVVVKNAANYSGKLLYQWYRVDDNWHAEAISEAESKSYTLSSSDVGFRVKVKVTYSDENDATNNGDYVESSISGEVVANNPPIATPDSIDVDEQVAAIISLSGTDPDGATPTTFQIISLPNDGTLTHQETVIESTALPYEVADSLLYQSLLDNPASSTSFTFKASDGHLYSEEATLTINIKPVNDTPTSDTVTLTNIVEDSGPYTIMTSALLEKAADAENDILSVSDLVIVNGSGTLNDNDNGNGEWIFTPASNDDSNISFSYKIADNGMTNGVNDSQSIDGTAVLEITSLNDAPTSDTVTLTNIAEDSGPFTIMTSALLAEAADVEDDTLTVSDLVIINGSGMLNIGDGEWIYTPADNENGNVSFSYKITDNGMTNGVVDSQSISGTAELEITPVNDPPSIDSTPTITVNEDEQYSYNIESSDVDGDSLTTTVTINGNDITQHGSWLSYTANQDGNGQSGLSGTPDNSHVGDYEVEITVVDDSDSPDSSTTTQSFTLSVLNVNTNIDLATITGDVGFTIFGDNTLKLVSDAGDVNGDGADDVIISPSGNNEKLYLIYGKKIASNASFNDLQLTEHSSVDFSVINDAQSESISAAGDVNGDGYDDVIIGNSSYDNTNSSYDNTNSGLSSILFGSGTAPLQEKVSIYGAANDAIGGSVSGAGDINGDGYADVIIGSGTNDTPAYIIYGSASINNIHLTDEQNPNAIGLQSIDESATHQKYRVSGAGDFDGDGFDDVIIATTESNDSYLVYGEKEPSGQEHVSHIAGTCCDKYVGNAGDINGDGFDDLIIGSPDATDSSDVKTGISYLLHGRSDRSDLIDLSNEVAYKIFGTADEELSGRNVGGGGDIDGDGYSDFIIGSKNIHGHAKSYVIYGSRDTEDINLSTIDQGSDYDKGFTIFHYTHGFSWDGTTTGAGDINHDGYDDIIIGSLKNHNSYILYGGPREHELVANGLSIRNLHSSIIGHRTDDQLTFNGDDAVLIGGAGDDNLTINNANFKRLDGGSGEDTLTFSANMDLDFTESGANPVLPTAIKDIEKFDLEGTNSKLTLAPIDVLNLSTTSNTLIVKGDDSSTVELPDDPTDGIDWTQTNNNWKDFATEAVITIVGDIYVHKKANEPVEMPGFGSVSLGNCTPSCLTFSEKQGSDAPHYLPLNDAVFHQLTELTIQLEFKLDFSRTSNTGHAYLLSLATEEDGPLRDNMMVIFLKKEGGNDRYDLKVWLENSNKKEKYIFRNKQWIGEDERGELTVALDLNQKELTHDGTTETDVQKILVYWQDHGDSTPSQVENCHDTSECRSNRGMSNFSTDDAAELSDYFRNTGIDKLIVDTDGAVFGNDQDSVGGGFQHSQAFEGDFYGLKIFKKFFDPSDPDAVSGAKTSLVYSLSPDNIEIQP